jgi:hypothetical protein
MSQVITMQKERPYERPTSGVEVTREVSERMSKQAEHHSILRSSAGDPRRPTVGSCPADALPVRLDPEIRRTIEERATADNATSSEVVKRALRNGRSLPAAHPTRDPADQRWSASGSTRRQADQRWSPHGRAQPTSTFRRSAEFRTAQPTATLAGSQRSGEPSINRLWDPLRAELGRQQNLYRLWRQAAPSSPEGTIVGRMCLCRGRLTPCPTRTLVPREVYRPRRESHGHGIRFRTRDLGNESRIYLCV